MGEEEEEEEEEVKEEEEKEEEDEIEKEIKKIVGKEECPEGYRGEDCDEEIWGIENDMSYGRVYERKKSWKEAYDICDTSKICIGFSRSKQDFYFLAKKGSELSQKDG